jgi:hypothetical protein
MAYGPSVRAELIDRLQPALSERMARTNGVRWNLRLGREKGLDTMATFGQQQTLRFRSQF